MTIYATITSKNQMTVPAEMRDDLGLKPGDKLKIEKASAGTYRVQKAENLASLCGIVKVPFPVSDELLQSWIAERRGRD